MTTKAKIIWSLSILLALVIIGFIKDPYAAKYLIQDFQILFGSGAAIGAAYLAHYLNQQRQREKEVRIALGKTAVITLELSKQAESLRLCGTFLKLHIEQDEAEGIGSNYAQMYRRWLSFIENHKLITFPQQKYFLEDKSDIALFSAHLLNAIGNCHIQLESLNNLMSVTPSSQEDIKDLDPNEQDGYLRKLNRITITILMYYDSLSDLFDSYIEYCEENKYEPIKVNIAEHIKEWNIIYEELKTLEPQEKPETKK